MQEDLFIPQYLRDSYKFELETEISVIDQFGIQFADTIFHPQGGGQPNDKGYIIYGPDSKKSDIIETNVDRQSGKIKYKLGTHDEFLKVGDKITIRIDAQLRKLHAKIHSAGHLLDLAVQNLKYPWETSKGYHFIDNPFVQYKGALQGTAEKIQNQINGELQTIIKSDISTIVQNYSYIQAVEKGLIPQKFKAPLIRIIKFDTSSCPCGGTHVKHVNEYKDIKVHKVGKKGKVIKVYYKVI